MDKSRKDYFLKSCLFKNRRNFVARAFVAAVSRRRRCSRRCRQQRPVSTFQNVPICRGRRGPQNKLECLSVQIFLDGIIMITVVARRQNTRLLMPRSRIRIQARQEKLGANLQSSHWPYFKRLDLPEILSRGKCCKKITAVIYECW